MNMQNSTVWVTPGDGVVRRTHANTYSNELFVSLVHDDPSALGYMMSSRFPVKTTITLTEGIPSSWVQWNVPEGSNEDIVAQCISMLSGVESIGEVPGNTRLWMTKREQSTRLRHVCPYAFFSITPHGFRPQKVPGSIVEALCAVVAGTYMIIEKSTVSSMKNSDKKSVSAALWKKMTTAYDIVSRHNQVAEACLISSYMEPSTTTAIRLFYLYATLGKERTHKLCDAIYYHVFEQQLYAVEEILEIVYRD